MDNAVTSLPDAAPDRRPRRTHRAGWDPREYSGRVCPACQVPRVHFRPRINHSFHFMMALGTLGLWLPVWGVRIVLQHIEPWTCSACTHRSR